jgi:hypothetical protein
MRRQVNPWGRELALPTNGASLPPHAKAWGRRAQVLRAYGPDPDTGDALDLGGAELDARPIETLNLAANGSDLRSITAPDGEGFLVTSLRGNSTGAFTAKMRIEDTTTDLQDQAVLGSLLFGNGQNPYVPRVPLLLAPNWTLSLTLADLSGAPNTLDITFEGLRIPGGANLSHMSSRPREQFFTFARTIDIAAGVGVRTELSQPLKVGIDAPFLLSDVNASVLTNWSLEVVSESGGSPWFQRPPRIETIAGNAQRPGTFVGTRILEKGEVFKVTAINQQAGAQAGTRIALIGAKLWHEATA